MSLAKRKRQRPGRQPEQQVDKSAAGHDGRPPLLVRPWGVKEVDWREKQGMARNANHCPICMYAEKKLISELQWSAGNRLQNDAALSQISPMRGSNMEAIGGRSTGPVSIADAKFDAGKRVQKALAAIGERGRAVLQTVVVEERYAEEASVTLAMDKRAVIPALAVALDALCVHYRLAPGEG